MKALNRSHSRGITRQIRVAQVEIGGFVNTQTPYLFGAVSVDSNANFLQQQTTLAPSPGSCAPWPPAPPSWPGSCRGIRGIE